MTRFLLTAAAAATLVFTSAAWTEQAAVDLAGASMSRAAVPAPGPRAAMAPADGPDRLVEGVARLIAGYGSGGRIGPDGIERYIGTKRADLRAREMREFLQADLDNDLSVSAAERDAHVAAADAGDRVRLLTDFRAADLDEDGTVGFAEMRARAHANAIRVLSEQNAADLRDLMLFDLDGDGFVALDEVRLLSPGPGRGA